MTTALKTENNKFQSTINNALLTALFGGYASKPVTINELASNTLTQVQHDYGYVSGYFWSTRTQTHDDWHAYSKQYHARYGPKRTVVGRSVTFAKLTGKFDEARHVGGNGLGIRQLEVSETITIELDSFRGNWLLDAAIKAGILQSNETLMNARLHAAYTLESYKETDTINVYKRYLGDIFVDYVVTGKGKFKAMTYHHKHSVPAVEGWRKKLERYKNDNLEKSKLVTVKLAKKLGFCNEGIKQFARDTGLNTQFAYELQTVLGAAIAAGVDKKYQYELDQLARNIG